MTTTNRWGRRAGVAGALTVAGALAALSGGCNVIGIFGGMAESYKKDSTHEIEAKYTGLRGKTVAVVVAADPAIASKYPDLIAVVTARVTERLADVKNDSDVVGVANPIDVLEYTYNHPGWAAKSRVDLGKELGGVQAIVMIEIDDYHLNDPGNSYLWNGVAQGNVGVFDLTSATPSEYAHRTNISVKFPDKAGQGPETFSAAIVDSQLAKRFIDRVSWLFYAHQEPYYPKY